MNRARNRINIPWVAAGFALLAGLSGACGESSVDTGDPSKIGSGASGGSGGSIPEGGSGGGEVGFGGGMLGGDADGDGLSDSEEGRFDTGGARDSDGDGTPDYQDLDSDDDGLSDEDEGLGDYDGDGIPNSRDSFNDGDPSPITLTAITTPFQTPVGIDYHEPSNSVVMSANYPSGAPYNLERVDNKGDHLQFSTLSGLTDEIKIGTARSGNAGGFKTGDLFMGNGLDGQILRITDDGSTIVNPWVELPGDNNGLIRGSLYVDRTGVFGGDLIVVTTGGEVWRITSAAVPTKLVDVDVHLEGMITVPNAPVRYGPLAGKIIAGAEGQGLLYAVDTAGTVTTHNVGVNVEDVDLIEPRENFFGINFGTSTLLGASYKDFEPLVGDILLTQEQHASTGLYRLQFDGDKLLTQEIPVTGTSAPVGQWEHVTMAPSGIKEVAPVEVPK